MNAGRAITFQSAWEWLFALNKYLPTIQAGHHDVIYVQEGSCNLTKR